MPDATTVGELPPPTLQDVAAMHNLGPLILEGVPLPDRVRMRGLCRAFKSLVDTSLRTLQKISLEDLAGLEWELQEGGEAGEALRWLAGKCPNLEVLDVGHPGRQYSRYLRWGKACEAPKPDAVATHLAAHCRQLRSLHLHRCGSVGDVVLRAVAGNCGDLRLLDIGYCKAVTDAGVAEIAAGCRRLEHLNVSHAKVTNASMSAIASHCRGLRHLDVHSTRVANGGITAIAQGCPDLRSLDVSNCAGINDRSIVAIAEKCRWLERADYGFTQVRDRGVAALLSHCSQLREFGIEDKATDDATALLGVDSCHQLRSLHITACESFSDAGAMSLAQRSMLLTSLYFDASDAATDASLSAFADSCPLLEELALVHCGSVTDAGMMAVASRCSRLRALRLTGLDGVTDAGMMAVASRCSRLRALRLTGLDGVTDAGAAELVKSSPDLRTLELSSCAGARTVRAAGTHCPELRHLEISDSVACYESEGGEDDDEDEEEEEAREEGKEVKEEMKEGEKEEEKEKRKEEAKQKKQGGRMQVSVWDGALAHVLHKSTRLETLKLAKCRGLSDAGISLASASHSCKFLRELSVSFCNHCRFTPQGLAAMAHQLGALEVLHVAGWNAVTDDSMAALAGHCPRLRSVVVSWCEVGDKGMVLLVSHCPLLVELRASGCVRVTDDSMLALSEHCPQLEEVSVSYCWKVTGSGATAVVTKCQVLRVLEAVNFLGCQVRPAKIKALKKTHPHVNVVATMQCGPRTLPGTQPYNCTEKHA
eukprot:jgi/Mesvir1/14849/Mv05468-RA.4